MFIHFIFILSSVWVGCIIYLKFGVKILGSYHYLLFLILDESTVYYLHNILMHHLPFRLTLLSIQEPQVAVLMLPQLLLLLFALLHFVLIHVLVLVL